jgi:hypothetical protein
LLLPKEIVSPLLSRGNLFNEVAHELHSSGKLVEEVAHGLHPLFHKLVKVGPKNKKIKNKK